MNSSATGIPCVDNINIRSHKILLTPEQVKSELPMSSTLAPFVEQSRKTICDILNQKDPRLLVVVGPCSIHDPDAALDYAKRLKILAEKVSDSIYIVMRVYFEKPRTTVGWKGLINDPNLDGSFKVEKGLITARKLLIDVLEMGVPTATEALDPISPQYLQDLISWTAIGARTSESQTHREMASGLSSPVGFKNGTDGNLSTAINAMKSCSEPHRFMGMNENGQVSIVETSGNKTSHIVLRGGGGKSNYDSVNVALCEEELKAMNKAVSIMIDCSHENSEKNHLLQPLVIKNVVNQILDGNSTIKALMIESNIGGGSQAIKSNFDDMEYGVSVTDKCIDWGTTEEAIISVHESLKYVLK